MVKRIFVSIILIFSFSCEELIEVEDISNEVVTILAPTDNITLDTTTVNFSWETLEFAETYQLQIASPAFDTAEVIVEDTITGNTNFVKDLGVANYQWRIKAINSAYETPFTIQNLTIED